MILAIRVDIRAWTMSSVSNAKSGDTCPGNVRLTSRIGRSIERSALLLVLVAIANACRFGLQDVLTIPVASVAEPAFVKAPVVCLSSSAPSEICATSDPYMVFVASLDSLNTLLLDQRQKSD